MVIDPLKDVKHELHDNKVYFLMSNIPPHFIYSQVNQF